MRENLESFFFALIVTMIIFFLADLRAGYKNPELCPYLKQNQMGFAIVAPGLVFACMSMRK